MKVIVVGGGIGGLAAAIAIRRAGHEVTVFERSRFSQEVGAAINVCPNASRILLEWGFDARRARMVTTHEQRVVEGVGLKTLVTVDCSEFDQAYGASFFLAHRVDLHNELRRLATESDAPVDISLSHEVVAYDVNGTVALRDGTVHRADLIVAADGIHSIAAREIVRDVAPAVPTGQSVFRFLIPTAELAADPELALLLERGVLKVLTGTDGRRLVWYPCADHTLQNFVGIHQTPRDGTTQGGKEGQCCSRSLVAKWMEGLTMWAKDWDQGATIDDVIAQYSDFHRTILSTIRKAQGIKRWPLLYREPLPAWTRGRLLLVGDAAHPMLPHQGQGGAQAIEDAGALESVLSNMPEHPSDEDIQQRLKIYEDIRLNRASAIQVFSNAGQDEAEKVRERARPFMPEGAKIPSSPAEYMEHNFRYDVLKESRLRMLLTTA